MSELRARINEDVKAAMRAKDRTRLSTLRMVTAALKQREVDERIELTDQHVLEILTKLVKQRQDSIDQYSDAGRQDLVDQERAEQDLIGEYLPAALAADEVSALVREAIADCGASSMKDMGKVMAELKPKLQGRADMGAVSREVKAALGAQDKV